MTHLVELQNVVELEEDEDQPPSEATLAAWVCHALDHVGVQASEITLRLVDEPEMVELNGTYRNKQGATNVLSFPLDIDIPQVQEEFNHRPLGDIVICHPIIAREAQEQNKGLDAHYAHMVVHGVLHLCGYDHEIESDALKMEALEVKLLAQRGVDNPYLRI